MPYKGSCLCGQIIFEVSAFDSNKMAHCHCSMCRKFHGSAFSTFGNVKLENLKWLTGAELLKTYVSENGVKRQFCECSGSSLTFQSAHDFERIEIALGVLDDPIEERPGDEIYFGNKADWYEPDERLVRFKGDRGEEPME